MITLVSSFGRCFLVTICDPVTFGDRSVPPGLCVDPEIGAQPLSGDQSVSLDQTPVAQAEFVGRHPVSLSVPHSHGMDTQSLFRNKKLTLGTIFMSITQ